MGYLQEKKIRNGLWKGTYTYISRKKPKSYKNKIIAKQYGIKLNNNTYKLIMKGYRIRKRK